MRQPCRATSATTCVRVVTSKQLMTAETCDLTVASEISSSLAMTLFDTPSISKPSTSVCRGDRFMSFSAAGLATDGRAANTDTGT